MLHDYDQNKAITISIICVTLAQDDAQNEALTVSNNASVSNDNDNDY